MKQAPNSPSPRSAPTDSTTSRKSGRSAYAAGQNGVALELLPAAATNSVPCARSSRMNASTPSSPSVRPLEVPADRLMMSGQPCSSTASNRAVPKSDSRIAPASLSVLRTVMSVLGATAATSPAMNVPCPTYCWSTPSSSVSLTCASPWVWASGGYAW